MSEQRQVCFLAFDVPHILKTWLHEAATAFQRECHLNALPQGSDYYFEVLPPTLLSGTQQRSLMERMEGLSRSRSLRGINVPTTLEYSGSLQCVLYFGGANDSAAEAHGRILESCSLIGVDNKRPGEWFPHCVLARCRQKEDAQLCEGYFRNVAWPRPTVLSKILSLYVRNGDSYERMSSITLTD